MRLVSLPSMIEDNVDKVLSVWDTVDEVQVCDFSDVIATFGPVLFEPMVIEVLSASAAASQ